MIQALQNFVGEPLRHRRFDLASSGTHVFDSIPHVPIQEQDRLAPAPSIRIFADCCFGFNSALMPGVNIGRVGCVIGANTVVTADLPPYERRRRKSGQGRAPKALLFAEVAHHCRRGERRPIFL
jgi:hypothetical protein